MTVSFMQVSKHLAKKVSVNQFKSNIELCFEQLLQIHISSMSNFSKHVDSKYLSLKNQ